MPWIKWNNGLASRREVLAIVTLLSRSDRDRPVTLLSRFDVAARCMVVWEWAGDNTPDGKIDGVTKADVDAIACLPGFGDAMISVGWLSETDSGLQFPNWEAHNSDDAKKRAIDSRRQARSRRRHDSVTEMSRSHRDNSVTREEKIREENKNRETTSLLSADADASTNGHMGPSASVLQEAWNRIVVKGQRCEVVSGKRAVHLKNRNRDPYFREHWQAALQKIAESPFCCGDNQRGWVATIDWFLRPDTVLKLIEGFYDGREPAAKGGFLAELYGGKA